MKIYCTACKGKPFKTAFSQQKMFRPIFLGELVSQQFIFRSAPCRNCKKINVVVRGVDIEFKPEEKEHIRYIK